jgi:hypothetical protein
LNINRISAPHIFLILSCPRDMLSLSMVNKLSLMSKKLDTVILYGKYWRNRGEYPKSKILPNLNYSGIHEYRSIFSGA